MREKYPDLEPLVKGLSYNQMFEFFRTAAMLRYTDKNQLNRVNRKIGTEGKLKTLTELEYLNEKNGIYTVAKKAFEALKQEKINTEFIQKTLRGGVGHEVKVSKAVQELMADDFYFVFYQNFTYLIPDACLLYKKDDKGKIVFLEVETEKPDWERYIFDKMRKYEELSIIRITYTSHNQGKIIASQTASQIMQAIKTK